MDDGQRWVSFCVRRTQFEAFCIGIKTMTTSFDPGDVTHVDGLVYGTVRCSDEQYPGVKSYVDLAEEQPEVLIKG